MTLKFGLSSRELNCELESSPTPLVRIQALVHDAVRIYNLFLESFIKADDYDSYFQVIEAAKEQELYGPLVAFLRSARKLKKAILLAPVHS